MCVCVLLQMQLQYPCVCVCVCRWGGAGGPCGGAGKGLWGGEAVGELWVTGVEQSVVGEVLSFSWDTP